MTPSNPSNNAHHELPFQIIARVLTQPNSLSRADLPIIHGADLGPAVRARLDAEHPLRAELQADTLKQTIRHAQIKAELHPLLSAWTAAGVPFVLLKGFAMAEFEYATAGERFYGDVDILLPEDPDQFMRAIHVALAHGWRSDHMHAHPDFWTHETAHLFGPDLGVGIDVHRFVAAEVQGASRAFLRRLTRGYWQRARIEDWEGTQIRRAHPLDAAVLNLAVGRQWGNDKGFFKPADYLDLEQLMHNHQLSEQDLSAHAASIGVTATWEATQQYCRPSQKHFVLDPLKTQALFKQALRRQGLSAKRAKLRRIIVAIPRLLPYALRTLPDVLAAWKAFRSGGDPRKHLQRWECKQRTKELAWRDTLLLISAIRHWSHFLYPRQRKRGVCVPRAYATYRALARCGYPTSFVSGVGRQVGQITGHAWLEELDGRTLTLYGEPDNRKRYKALFVYPDAPNTR